MHFHGRYQLGSPPPPYPPLYTRIPYLVEVRAQEDQTLWMEEGEGILLHAHLTYLSYPWGLLRRRRLGPNVGDHPYLGPQPTLQPIFPMWRITATMDLSPRLNQFVWSLLF